MHGCAYLEYDLLFLLLCEAGALGVNAGIGVGGGHQELRTLDDVVLLWIVLEENVVAVCSSPVVDTVQHLLMVFQHPLCRTGGEKRVSQWPSAHGQQSTRLL